MSGSKPGKFHPGQENAAVIAAIFLSTIIDISPLDITNGQKKLKFLKKSTVTTTRKKKITLQKNKI
jgi:hypothetical protein